MNLHRCDICEHLEEPNERFFHLFETTSADGGFSADVCEKCFKKFENLKFEAEVN